jgi:hypothetical protein
MKSDIPRYVDEKEVSRIIGRAVQTLRNDRFRGQGVPYVKMGRAVRYRLSDVIAFMEDRKIKTAPIER